MAGGLESIKTCSLSSSEEIVWWYQGSREGASFLSVCQTFWAGIASPSCPGACCSAEAGESRYGDDDGGDGDNEEEEEKKNCDCDDVDEDNYSRGYDDDDDSDFDNDGDIMVMIIMVIMMMNTMPVHPDCVMVFPKSLALVTSYPLSLWYFSC